jgi:hypothetical protein
MRVPVLILLLLAVGLAAGCQQADGPIPEQNEEITNRIDDLSRDVLNVAGGNQQAPDEFLDDLLAFGEGSDGSDADTVRALGRAFTPAITGKAISEEAARRIATQLWFVTAGWELSERQGETVLNGLRDALGAAGLSQVETEPVIAQASATQKALTVRPRRWYERF